MKSFPLLTWHVFIIDVYSSDVKITLFLKDLCPISSPSYNSSITCHFVLPPITSRNPVVQESHRTHLPSSGRRNSVKTRPPTTPLHLHHPCTSTTLTQTDLRLGPQKQIDLRKDEKKNRESWRRRVRPLSIRIYLPIYRRLKLLFGNFDPTVHPVVHVSGTLTFR